MKIEQILIVGHKGAMGSYFMRTLSSVKGIEVLGVDKPLPSDFSRYLSKVQMVLLCVPLSALEGVMREMGNLASQKFILVDISSVKVFPMKIMLNYYKGPVVGTHPLFGPSPKDHIPLRIAMVKGRGNQAFEDVRYIFKRAGFETFECSAQEHDHALAFIQALNFVTTLSYFAAFSEDPSLLKFITPSFSRRLNAAKKMLTQDSTLFQQLFETNPYSHEAVKRFRSFLNLASAGDLDLLVEKAWWWWREENKGEGVPG